MNEKRKGERERKIEKDSERVRERERQREKDRERERERGRQRDSIEILEESNHRRVHNPGKKIENDQESCNY